MSVHVSIGSRHMRILIKFQALIRCTWFSTIQLMVWPSTWSTVSVLGHQFTNAWSLITACGLPKLGSLADTALVADSVEPTQRPVFSVPIYVGPGFRFDLQDLEPIWCVHAGFLDVLCSWFSNLQWYESSEDGSGDDTALLV